MAKNNVLINGLSAVTSGSSGILMTSPDVCKTTCGPATVPIPYPNIAESKDLAGGSSSVMIEGNPACLESSTFAQSTGDESGDQKGTVSNTIQDEAKPGLFSPTVFIEGKAIVRNTDIFTSNKMNTPPAPVMQAQVGPGVGSSSEYELQEFSQQLNIELAEQDDGEALDFILGHQLIVIANTADGKNVQRQIHQVEGNILPTRIYTTEEQEFHTHLVYSQYYDSMRDESIITSFTIDQDIQTVKASDPLAKMAVRETSKSKNKSRFRNVHRKQYKNGKLVDRKHHGIDLKAAKKDNLMSILDGEVITTVSTFKSDQYAVNSFGNKVIIESIVRGSTVRIMYCHLDSVSVKEGDSVTNGDIIGKVGKTGNAAKMTDSEVHVHIEAATGGSSPSKGNNANRVNPELYIPTKFDSEGNALT